jgi:hypothetical protein
MGTFRDVGSQWCNRLPLMRDKTHKRRPGALIVGDHHMIEEDAQEAAIGAFLVAHEGHTQEVEIQRGAWSIYCRCRRCDDIHTFEVDNEARERAIGLPPWPELRKKMG